MTDEQPTIFGVPDHDGNPDRFPPPWTIDVSRIKGVDISRPQTVNLDGHAFSTPAGVRYVRYGVNRDGVYLDYQEPDGMAWTRAQELPDREEGPH